MVHQFQSSARQYALNGINIKSYIPAQVTETDVLYIHSFQFPPSLASLSATKFLLQIYMELTELNRLIKIIYCRM